MAPKKHTTICLIILFCLPLLNLAHGIEHKLLDNGVGVEVFYLDGTPMSDCDVEVFAPGDTENPFQRGQMDQNGRFVFSPDEKGNWTVIVDDGMGHRATIKVVVDKEMKAGTKESGQLAMWQKIAMVLSLIFGLTGVYYYFLTRKNLLAQNSDN